MAITCSAWKGGTFGVRVGNTNAKKYFRKRWTSIEVTIEGKTHAFNLSKIGPPVLNSAVKR